MNANQTRFAILLGFSLLEVACGPVQVIQYGTRRFYREAKGIRWVWGARP